MSLTAARPWRIFTAFPGLEPLGSSGMTAARKNKTMLISNGRRVKNWNRLASALPGEARDDLAIVPGGVHFPAMVGVICDAAGPAESGR